MFLKYRKQEKGTPKEKEKLKNGHVEKEKNGGAGDTELTSMAWY